MLEVDLDFPMELSLAFSGATLSMSMTLEEPMEELGAILELDG